MFGSEVLEVAIGIVFVFLLVSVLCSALREGIEAWMKTRAAYLERGVRELLHDHEARPDGLARAVFEHPLVYGLYATPYRPGAAGPRPPIFVRGRGLPSYIPSRNFALALLDIAARGPVAAAGAAPGASDAAAPVLSVALARQNVAKLGNPAVQRVVLTALDAAGDDLARAQAAIEAWYDSGMDRVSGWYKRATYWIIFWLGLAVAAALNVDAIAVGRHLYRDDAARAAIVAEAERAAGDTAYLARSRAETRAELDALRLPIGWPARAGTSWPAAVPGWLITAIAATLGAPFWFDLLNRIMVIRSTVKPHEKSREESSEDRQPAATRGGGVAAERAAG